MKKLALLLFAFVFFTQANAQTKITKNAVIGKWNVSAVEMTGMFYFSIEKDSLAIGEMMKSQVKDEGQLSAITSMMKPQLAVFKTLGFTFNADGTAELGAGTSEAQSANYTVDEANSTITTITKDKKEQTLKADTKDDTLRITVIQPQGEIFLILKKSKS